MKLLHLGCHQILEFDELRLFTQIKGLEVFSPGAYLNPNGIGGRPAIPELEVKPEWIDAWSRVPSDPTQDPPLSDQKANLTPEILSHFDAVMIMHVPNWITNNWKTLKEWGGTVYWRAIGQTLSEQEALIGRYAAEGLKIIRYSPHERQIPNYAGEDALIRFSKDPSDFLPWVGDRLEVMTIAQSMKDRGTACGYDIFLDSTRPFTRRLYGNSNESSGQLWQGQKSYEQLLEFLSWTRCYFYTGTYPAPYTLNFMEAALAGTPIVAIGKQLSRFQHYEVPDILSQWGLGEWVGNKPSDLQELCLRTLSMTSQEAQQRSDSQRAQAASMFGYDAIKPLWKELFGL